MASAAQASAGPTRGESAPLTRNRAIAVWALVVVASILMLFSSLTIWVKRQALDTDAWTNTSGQMLANDEIRQQLSIYLVDTLFSSADATARIQQALPPKRQALAPVISGALQSVAVQAADRLLQTPQVQALWEAANKRAHQDLLDILNGKDKGRFETANGEVVLDLSPLVTRLSDRFGVQAAPDAGKITILQSGQLKTAQRALKMIKVLSVFLLVLVLFLYGLAIYLAHGHRRRILRAIAVSFLLVGVLVLVIQSITGGAVVNSLIKTDALRPAGNAAWGIGTELLRNVAYALILYGVAGLIGAWLAGSTRWAVSARRRLAPVFEDQAWIVYVAVAVLFLLVLAWGPTRATREWWGILLLGGLLFFGVAMLHRQTVREFPAAKAAS
ncbi:MAG: hypothetical protein E6G31_10945 [Actinobacteria bacterium]|nr:MAG: hypothetical protein E6G31_10945 [Actinomycetota bacterium]